MRKPIGRVYGESPASSAMRSVRSLTLTREKILDAMQAMGDRADHDIVPLSIGLYPRQISNWDLVCAFKSRFPDAIIFAIEPLPETLDEPRD